MSQIETIAQNLSKLTVMEAAQLAKMLEEEWGVSAAAPVAMVAASGGAAAPAAAEQTEFALHLIDSGATKINVIKEVRAITGLGLAEAKALVDGAPKVVKEGLSKEDVAKFKEMLEKAGAKVEVK